MKSFKKLTIEPKRKYIYLTFDNYAKMKIPKEDFSMDMTVNLACKCKEPLKPGFIDDKNFRPYCCLRCGRRMKYE